MEYKRVAWVDMAKILAIFAVITIHTVATLILNYKFGSKLWWVGNIIVSSVRWSVPLFVMLSGYTLLGKNESMRLLFQKRTYRVGIPFVAWTIVYFCWDKFHNKVQLTSNLIVERILSGSPFVHLYFFYIILGLYLITPALRIVMQNSSRRLQLYLLLIAFSFSILQSLLNYYMPNLSVRLNAFTYFLFYICYYVAGHYLKDFKLKGKKLITCIVILMLSIVITSVLTYINGSTPWIYYYDYLSYNVVIMTITLFVVFNSLNDYINKYNYLCKTAKNLAPNVLGIYAIHIIVMDLLSQGIFGIQVKLNIGNLITSLPFTIVTVFIISFVITYVGKRIPVIKLIFG